MVDRGHALFKALLSEFEVNSLSLILSILITVKNHVFARLVESFNDELGLHFWIRCSSYDFAAKQINDRA
jgi:hypothetical protein